eukprot:COSAG02_NODE_8287_length_2631_cov_25.944322_4_plen_234_part_01
MASASQPARASLADPSTVRPSMQSVPQGAVVSDDANPPIVDQVAKPSSPRRSTYQNVSTTLPPRTPSPTPSEEVPTDEIGGQWRKQFGDSNFKSTLEDDDDGARQEWETRATKNRCAVVRVAPTSSKMAGYSFSSLHRLAYADSTSCAVGRHMRQAAVPLVTHRHMSYQSKMLCLRSQMWSKVILPMLCCVGSSITSMQTVRRNHLHTFLLIPRDLCSVSRCTYALQGMVSLTK